MKAFRAWLFLGLISACSSDNSTLDGGATDAGNDVTVTKDSGSDVTQGSDTGSDVTVADAPADVTTSDASDGGSGFTLTINDYLHWCNVSVNGGANSAQDPQTFQFAPDASVALHGDTAGSQFYWGYWQSASLGDGGLDLSKDAAIQMNANVSVLACCPVNNTGLHCP
ncbi:MAG TPA: hypothetical protein VH054_05475 [Polyangiaceae bacterium]|jgi:hypothetical protein|nr:hypothetical protein [Polyangiaceae bacterium]